MKLFLILALLVCLSAYKGSAQDHKLLIKQTAQAMADAQLKEDYATLVSYLYNPFVQREGGADSIANKMRRGIKQVQANGQIVKRIEIGEPGNEVAIADTLYSVVPEPQIVEFRGANYLTPSYLIAISTDKGNHWVFVSAYIRGLRSMLPQVDRLNIPPLTVAKKLN
jgi:hypothetical protein